MKWNSFATISTVLITVAGTLYTTYKTNTTNLEAKNKEIRNNEKNLLMNNYFDHCDIMTKEYFSYVEIREKTKILMSKQDNIKYNRTPITEQEENELIENMIKLEEGVDKLSIFLTNDEYKLFITDQENREKMRKQGAEGALFDSYLPTIYLETKLRKCNLFIYMEPMEE